MSRILDCDKLEKWIEENSYRYMYRIVIPCEKKANPLLDFIKANSVEVADIQTTSVKSAFLKGIKGNCDTCFYAINGEEHTGIPCNDCDRFANKWRNYKEVGG